MGQERKLTALLAAFALLPAATCAEPGAAIRYLMEEPASLMDVGFIRLNAYLQESADTLTAALNEQDPVSRFSSVQIAAEYYCGKKAAGGEGARFRRRRKRSPTSEDREDR